MNKKITAGIIVTLLLTIGVFYVPFPTKAFEGQIDFGVIGPVLFIQEVGMREGAEMAKTEINDNGGITLPAGTWGPAGGYEMVLHYGDEYMMNPGQASRDEMARLIEDEGCQFVIGGFRTEATEPMRDEAAAHAIDPAYERPIYIIAGSSTDQLIDCGTGTCGACVRCDYALYQYTFRYTPVNSTILFTTILSAAGQAIAKLNKIYEGATVNTAIVCETLSWTVAMRAGLAAYLPMYGANIVYNPATVDPYASDYTSIITAIKDAHARLVINVFSSEGGRAFARQCHPSQLDVNASLIGIDVLGQMSESWDLPSEDDGLCEYETFLASTGTRTPMTDAGDDLYGRFGNIGTTAFWDAYVARWGHAPIYTAWGVYDGLIGLAETIENAESIDIDAVKTEMESGFERTGLLGKFKFTEYHDVYCDETGTAWENGYVRAHMVQWQRTASGAMVVVAPNDQDFSRRWMIAITMYSLDGFDISLDGKVNILDAIRLAGAFGTRPGDTNWNIEADIKVNGVINILDAISLASKFGKSVTPFPMAQ